MSSLHVQSTEYSCIKMCITGLISTNNALSESRGILVLRPSGAFRLKAIFFNHISRSGKTTTEDPDLPRGKPISGNQCSREPNKISMEFFRSKNDEPKRCWWLETRVRMPYFLRYFSKCWNHSVF